MITFITKFATVALLYISSEEVDAFTITAFKLMFIIVIFPPEIIPIKQDETPVVFYVMSRVSELIVIISDVLD